MQRFAGSSRDVLPYCLVPADSIRPVGSCSRSVAPQAIVAVAAAW